MNNAKPDDIQSQPSKQPPAEIQAHAPPPRYEAPAPLADYDFKKPSSWGLGFWIPAFGATGICVLTAVSFLGQVTNKTFSNVTHCGSFTASPGWAPQGVQPQAVKCEHERQHLSDR